MHINKPSVTKIEAADRFSLLQSTSCRFEQYPCPDMRHFMIATKETLAFRHTNLTLDNFIKPR